MNTASPGSTMNVRYKLSPVSALAVELCEERALTDVALPHALRIGRNVPRLDGFALKIDWIQFSQNHCRVYCKEDDSTGKLAWFVEDTSTNGTWVNEARIPKGGSLQIHDGDMLRLSTPPSEVLEWKFVAEEVELSEAKGDNYSADKSVPQQKRRKTCDDHATIDALPGTSVADAGGPGSRRVVAARSPTAAAPLGLAEVEKQVADLRRKLAAARSEADEQRAELQQLRAAAAAAANEDEARRAAATTDADARFAQLSEAASRDVAAAVARAGDADARAADAEARHAAEAGARAAAEQARSEAEAALAEERAASARQRADAGAAAAAAEAELAELRRDVAAISARNEAAEAAAADKVASLTRERDEARGDAARASEAAWASARRDASVAAADRAARLRAEAATRDLEQALHEALCRADAAEERAQAADTRVALVRHGTHEAQSTMAAAEADVLRLLGCVRARMAELATCADADVEPAGHVSMPTQAAATVTPGRAGMHTGTAATTAAGHASALDGGACGGEHVACATTDGVQPMQLEAALGAAEAASSEHGTVGAAHACHALPETQMAWGTFVGAAAVAGAAPGSGSGRGAPFGSAPSVPGSAAAHMGPPHAAAPVGSSSGAFGSIVGYPGGTPLAGSATAAPTQDAAPETSAATAGGAGAALGTPRQAASAPPHEHILPHDGHGVDPSNGHGVDPSAPLGMLMPEGAGHRASQPRVSMSPGGGSAGSPGDAHGGLVGDALCNATGGDGDSGAAAAAPAPAPAAAPAHTSEACDGEEPAGGAAAVAVAAVAEVSPHPSDAGAHSGGGGDDAGAVEMHDAGPHDGISIVPDATAAASPPPHEATPASQGREVLGSMCGNMMNGAPMCGGIIMEGQLGSSAGCLPGSLGCGVGSEMGV